MADENVIDQTDNTETDTTTDTSTDTSVDSPSTPNFLDMISNDETKTQLEGYDADKLATEFLELKSNQVEIPEAEGYQLEKWPEDIPKDEEGYNAFIELAREKNIPPDVWKDIVQFDLERHKKATAAMDAQIDAAEQQLKGDWGEKYDENITRAKKVLEVAGAKELVDMDVGNHPELAKLLVWVADKVLEDSSGPRPGNYPPGTELGEIGTPILNFKDM